MAKPSNFMGFERPDVGDRFHRYSSVGMYEEAMITAIIGPADHFEHWTAVLMPRNGVEFVSNGDDYRNKLDWVPGSWIYDEFNKAWIDPTVSVEEAPQFDEAKIPSPAEKEKYMAWRARVYRELPDLKGNEQAKALLSRVWRDHARANASA